MDEETAMNLFTLENIKPPMHPLKQHPETEIRKETLPLELCLFAEDLLSFYMKTKGLNWKPADEYYKQRQQTVTRCNKNIKIAVTTIAETEDLSTEIDNLYEIRSISAYSDFLTLVHAIYLHCFPGGYIAPSFLKYCSFLVEIGTFGFSQGFANIPEYVVNDMVTVLKSFFDQKEFDLFGGWEHLTDVAKLYA